MDDSCRYLPHSERVLRGKAQRLFRLLTYDVWRRELNRALGARGKTERVRLVDVGCGPGFLLRCLEKWFPAAQLIGVDASDQLLEIAKSRCRAIQVFKSDACSLPLPGRSVDALFALHVVEHLPCPLEFFAEAFRVLRPGALLILATPNADGLGVRLMQHRWLGYSDPTHVSLHAPPYWRHLLSSSGFHVARDGTTGLSDIPILNHMPFGLIHWVPSFFFGFYPWQLGAAYVCSARRSTGQS